MEKLINAGIQKGYFRNDLTFNSLFVIQMHKLSGMANAHAEFQNINYTKETFVMLLVNDIRGITTIEGHKILDDKVKEIQKMINT